jgi:hypothetical protein
LKNGFAIMGGTPKNFFKPNWNSARNFHGVWFADSDRLEQFVPFRTETPDDFWKRIFAHYWYYNIAKIVPHFLISALVFQPLLNNNTNSPHYWVNHKKNGRVMAFYGGYEAFKAIPNDWKDYPLLCEGKASDGTSVDYATLKATPQNLLSHGYDESKGLENLNFVDLCEAAAFRGGKCLSFNYTAGAIHTKVQWECAFGHTFFATPFTILRGGFWCPHCEPKPWAYGKQAKQIPFYAQVWYDTHTKEEEGNVYPLSEQEDDFLFKV